MTQSNQPQDGGETNGASASAVRRRRFLVGVTASASLLAGCGGSAGITETTNPTSDSDGAATETPLPTDTVGANYQPFADRTHHFREYGITSATVTVVPELLDASAYSSEVKVLVVTSSYPRGKDAYAYGTSPAFELGGEPKTVTVEAQETNRPPEPVFDRAFLVSADKPLDDVSLSELTFLAESNRYRVTDSSIESAPHPKSLEDASTKTYDRTSAEGAYILKFRGSTLGERWSISYVTYKSSYVAKATADRMKAHRKYVAAAQGSGTATKLARVLKDEADRIGLTSKKEHLTFLIQFVQNFPYVTDNVSKGYDDYTKFMAETLTEAEGDCEDTSILMAALLQSDPFGYDATLLVPPGHMGVGVYATGLPGTYVESDGRRYYYVETTGEGWGVGDLPDMYLGQPIKVLTV